MKKSERLYTMLCGGLLSFALSLGALACLVSAIELDVPYGQLTGLCAAIAAVWVLCFRIRWGFFLPLGILVFLCTRSAVWLEMKTVAAVIMEHISLGYDLAFPWFLEGNRADSLLLSMLLLSGGIQLLSVWAVTKQKTIIPAAMLSLLPLCGCITVTDTVPDALWVYLWGLALVLLIMTQSTRRRNHRQANRLTATLLLPAAAALGLLFLLVPREPPTYEFLEALPEQLLEAVSKTETSPAVESSMVPDVQVSLTDRKHRYQERNAVMEVTATFSGELYLRGRHYTNYAGTAWSTTEGHLEPLLPPEYATYDTKYTVKIHPLTPAPLYYLPVHPVASVLLTDGQFENPELKEEYSFQCVRPYVPEYLIDTNFDNENVDPAYLALPSQTLADATAYLQEHGILEMSPWDQTDAIRDLVKNSAPYDLRTPKMPSDQTDLAMWFLRESDSGYCIHYATATTVLLRAVGIPARYVVGYMVPVTEGQTVTVRQKDAHAWVEYYVGGAGWLLLEPTPPDLNAGFEEPPVTLPTEPEPTEPPTEPKPTEPTDPTGPTTEATEPPTEPPAKTAPEPSSGHGLWLWCLLAAVMAVAGLYLQYRLRRRLLKKRFTAGTANQQAMVLYRQLKRLHRFLKLDIPSPALALAKKARFSHHTLTEQELSMLQRFLHKAESAVKKRPVPLRLYAKYILNLF